MWIKLKKKWKTLKDELKINESAVNTEILEKDGFKISEKKNIAKKISVILKHVQLK